MKYIKVILFVSLIFSFASAHDKNLESIFNSKEATGTLILTLLNDKN